MYSNTVSSSMASPAPPVPAPYVSKGKVHAAATPEDYVPLAQVEPLKCALAGKRKRDGDDGGDGNDGNDGKGSAADMVVIS